jgi:hypothetical protein
VRLAKRTAALLHCCTAALLHCCTAALLHCCASAQISSQIIDVLMWRLIVPLSAGKKITKKLLLDCSRNKN